MRSSDERLVSNDTASSREMARSTPLLDPAITDREVMSLEHLHCDPYPRQIQGMKSIIINSTPVT
jgi:hypothetical protein